jgi:6-pyruvoyltetrahydropterin/6-carboxytetrahydropterin synthase
MGTALCRGLREHDRAVEPSRKQDGRRLRLDFSVRYHRRTIMYLATKRIDFCYGHRLLDYDGVCKHPHGHNAIAEIDVRTDALDRRNMVADFSDIKRLVKGWIDRELDHKMILRHDDPLVAPLRALGEPMYLLESNPTVERIAKLIYDKGRELGLDIVTVRVWETPTAFATYGEILPGATS